MTADRADIWTFGACFRRVLARAVRVLASAGQIPFGWLAALPRRLGGRLFAKNDAEARWHRWHRWQVTRTHGGLGRRYRDPQFGTLAACPQCGGAGITVDPPCLDHGEPGGAQPAEAASYHGLEPHRPFG